MSFVPASVAVEPGTRLVLNITNSDTQQHDLKLGGKIDREGWVAQARDLADAQVARDWTDDLDRRLAAAADRQGYGSEFGR